MTLSITLDEQAGDVAALARTARELTERVELLEAGIRFALWIYAREEVTGYGFVNTESVLFETLAGDDFRDAVAEADRADA